MRQEIGRFLCSVKEAAEAIGCHPKTYDRWARAGKVPMWIYVAGERRVVIAELEATIAERVADRDRPPPPAPLASAQGGKFASVGQLPHR